MPLSFLCPNGHRISCAEDQAGRTARCPKCAAVFRIPASNGSTAHAATELLSASEGGSAKGLVSQSGIHSPAGSKVQAEELFVFLCPNGHRLNGSLAMQGKPGQCPHCGAKFVVPLKEEAEQISELGLADDAPKPNQPAIQGITRSARADDDDPLPLEEDMQPSSTGGGSGGSGGASRRYPFSSASSNAHPLCALVSKLWEEKQHGAIIELHLEGGAMLVPDWFDEPMSRQSHGLFAAQSADGTVTMTIVSWEKVARVVVRNVEGLPEGMFE